MLVFNINLIDDTVEIMEKINNEPVVTMMTHPEIDITEKKTSHFLALINDNKPQAGTVLDNYLALELSARILKKINSLYD